MKTKQILTKSLFALTMVGLTLTSCKKDDTDTSVAQNYSTSENANNDMDAIADQADAGKSFKMETVGGILNDTAVITTTISGDTTKHCIDFGTGITCKDGKVRKGKIYVERIKQIYEVGMTRTITTDNYYVNGNKVEGKRVATLTSLSLPTWTITGDVTITLTDGNVVTATTSRTRVWTEGSTTLFDFTDDKFSITGTASKTAANGTNVEAEITTALVYSVGCHQFVSGILKITPSGKEARIIDFGTGACDETVTVTVGTHSKTFTAKQ